MLLFAIGSASLKTVLGENCETEVAWIDHHPGEGLPDHDGRRLVRGGAKQIRAKTQQAKRDLKSEKVEVCMIPPGNDGNYHTVTVSENAVDALLATGSIMGSCNEACDSFCDDANKCTIDHNGNCEDEGCAAEPRELLVCDDGIDCTVDSCDPVEGCIFDDSACPVQITEPGEAYGHHGRCAGWNGCGDAATCALKACNDHGYETLVSYGDSGPCTGFDVCHLFWNVNNNVCSVQYDWGNWCRVAGVTDIVCKDPSDICVYDGP